MLFLESGVTEVLIVLATFWTAVYLYCTSQFGFWSKLGVPYVKPSFPFGNVGKTLMGVRAAGDTFKALYHSKEFAGARFGGAWFLGSPILVPMDLDLIKEILIKDFAYFSDRGLPFNEKKEPLGAHLFNLGGWRWRVLRTKLTPTFTSGKIKTMFATMAECAQGLDRLLEAPAQRGAVIEMKEPLAQFTTDIIGTIAFGLNFNSIKDDDSEFRQMGRLIFKPSWKMALKRLMFTLFPGIIKHTPITFLPKDITQFFMGTVANTVKEREEKNIRRSDVMQMLIDIKNQGTLIDEVDKFVVPGLEVPKDASGRQVFELNNDLLAAQAFIFFIAGFETSATAMGFALYELARSPECQDKLVEEITSVLADHDDQITYEAIQQMKYLDMVCCETLRKYPPVGNIFRRVTRHYKIPGSDVTIPPGIRVFIPIYAIQNDPKYYPEPEKFIPERFSPAEKAARHPMLFLSFGAGPRNCIGERFGLLQTKLGLITVLRKYKVDVSEETTIPPTLDPKAFITALQGGVKLRISLRNN